MSKNNDTTNSDAGKKYDVETSMPQHIYTSAHYEPHVRATMCDDARVFCVAVIPGTPYIATGGAPTGDIYLWNTVTERREIILVGHKASVFNMIFCRLRCVLYSASSDHTAIQWDPIRRTRLGTFEGHRGFVVGLAVREGGAREASFFTGSDDTTVKQWNTDTGDCVATLGGHEGPVNAITCNDMHLFSGTVDGRVFVWDLMRRKMLRSIQAHDHTVWAMVLLPDGRLITGAADTHIRVWDNPVVNDDMKEELNGHSDKIRTMVLHGPMLFTAGADKVINVWNLNSMRLVSVISGKHDKTITSMCLHSNELTTVGFDRRIHVMQVEDLLPVKQHEIELDFVEVEERKLEYEEDKRKEHKKRQMEEESRLEEGHRARRIQDQPMDEIISHYTTLPIKTLLPSLKAKVESSRLMSDLTLFIPFVISFVFFFLLSHSVEDGFYTAAGLERTLLHRDMPDIRLSKKFGDGATIGDWVAWTRGVMLPELFSGRTRNSAITNDLRGENRLLGSLRFRTQRVTNRSCEVNQEILNVSAVWADWGRRLPIQACYANLGGDAEDKAPYACAFGQCDITAAKLAFVGLGSNGFNFTENAHTLNGHLRNYHGGGYMVDIPLTDTLDEAISKFDTMINLGFVDTIATRFVAAQFYTYNPYLDGFVSSIFYYEIAQGGAWLPFSKSRVFYIFQNNAGQMVFEGYFMCFVLVFLGIYLRRMYKAIRAKRLLAFIIDVWNLLEIVNIVIFLVMYMYRIQWMWSSTDLDIKIPVQPPRYLEDLEDASELFVKQVWLNAINTVLTFLNLLKFVRLNDRLNILTRTLAAAQQNLIGVLLLFVYFVFAFALSGNAIYGAALYEFRTLDGTFNSLMRMLLGDFDYDTMFRENEIITVPYFWSFLILGLFVLLNFLAAIISDAFSDVSRVQVPIPLDKAIVKTAKDAVSEILPKSIAAKILLMKHRRTQTGVVVQLMKCMCEQYPIYAPVLYREADIDFIEDETRLTKEEFLELLPDDVAKLSGERFLDEIWHDLCWERHFKLLDDSVQQQHEHEEFILEKVHEAMRHFRDTSSSLNKMQGAIDTMNYDVGMFTFDRRDAGVAGGGGSGTTTSSENGSPVLFRSASQRMGKDGYIMNSFGM
eukprot:PhM_4_TR10552/c0_g1_i1/m.60525